MIRPFANRVARTRALAPSVTVKPMTIVAVLAGGRYQVTGDAGVVEVPTVNQVFAGKVGDVVQVLCDASGAPRYILNVSARRGQPSSPPNPANGLVEELFVATVDGGTDVYFRNDQQLTALGLEAYATGSRLDVGWGLNQNSFWLAVGDPEALSSYAIHVFKINRDKKDKVLGAKTARATFVRTWNPVAQTQHLSKVEFRGRLVGFWYCSGSSGGVSGASGGGIHPIDITWEDDLEIDLQDMAEKDCLVVRSIVLEESTDLDPATPGDLTVLLEADVEKRRTDFVDVYPRQTYGVQIIDSSDYTEGTISGNIADIDFRHDDGLKGYALQATEWRKQSDPTLEAWTIDPGKQLFLVNTTAGSVTWRSMKDPFVFRWRKILHDAFLNDTAPAFGDEIVINGINYTTPPTGTGGFWGHLGDPLYLSLADARITGYVGDELIGSFDGLRTNRNPIDPAKVPFIADDQEIEIIVNAEAFGEQTVYLAKVIGSHVTHFVNGPPADPSQPPTGDYTVDEVSIQAYARNVKRLYRKRYDDIVPAEYAGRKQHVKDGPTLSGKGIFEELYVQRVGFHDFAHAYVPDTPVVANIIGGTHTILTVVPDFSSGAETKGQRKAAVKTHDLQTGVARSISLTEPNVASADFRPLTCNEFHLLWEFVVDGVTTRYLTKLKDGTTVALGPDSLGKLDAQKVRIIRPAHMVATKEPAARFVKAWDRKTFVPGLTPAIAVPTSASLSGLAGMFPLPASIVPRVELGKERSSWQAINLGGSVLKVPDAQR